MNKKADTTLSASKTISLRPLLAGLLIFTIFMSIAADPAAAAKKRAHAYHAPKVNPNRYAAYVIDAASGQVLYQSNAERALYPASLTKIMTLLVVFQALDSGKLSLDDRVPISAHAASMPPSKLGLKPGSSIRVKDAVYAIVTKSANDIAVALAEKVGGSESHFATIMNAKAQDLGLAQTHFVNASGLHNARQTSSAHDMAKLARYVINNYPDYYRFYSMQNFSYAGYSYHTHNGLMKSYKGMDGMKTGYISQSGFNLVASAVRDNHRVIGVVFGGQSAQSRNTHMASLLDAAFVKLKSQPQVLVASATDSATYVSDVKAAAVDVTPGASLKAGNKVQPAVIHARQQQPVPIPPRKPGILVAANALDKLAPALGTAGTTLLQTPPANDNAHLELASADTIAAPVPSSWAIQIGAYTSRAATDKALHDSMEKLPVKYASLSPMIAPLKTNDGWLFRARLHGLSHNDALKACKYLTHCVPVAPKS